MDDDYIEKVLAVIRQNVPCGETVNKEFYLNVLKRLTAAVRRKRPEAWTNNTWMLQHDNAPAHVSLSFREFLTKREASVVPQTPYSPELAPADFFLFPNLKSSLKGRRFQTVEEIEENSILDLRAIPKNKFQNWKNVGSGYQEGRGVIGRREV
jgi:transposase